MRTRVDALTLGALALVTLLAGCQKPPVSAEAPASSASLRAAAPAPATPKAWIDYTVKECQAPLLANREFAHCQQETKAVARLFEREVTLLSNRGDANCNAEDGCKQTVHVKEDEAGNCTAELRYGKLEVMGSKKGRKVVWNLSPPPGQTYNFASPGIGVSPTEPPVYADPTLWWSAANASLTQAVLNIENPPVTGTAKPEFCHFPRVVNRRRNDGQLCCPIDPIIINHP